MPHSPQPNFSDFPAQEVFTGRSTSVKIHTSFEQRFRTRIKNAALEKPNFAGHLVVASWGCGMACLQTAIVNLKTGRVYDGPFGDLTFGVQHTYEGGVEPGLEFRPTSRLLIIRGCPNEQLRCGTYYFVWAGETLYLLKEIKAGEPISR